MEIKIFQKGFNYSQDGPGNRMVYHLQGCNLRCPWCSNPEGLSCTGGKSHTVEALVKDALSCRSMFFDGGGVTMTGGEVTMQFDAVKAFMAAMKENGVHTAIETNGIHRRLPELFPVVDYLIMDCKHYDPEIHRKVTGRANDQTIENLKKAIEAGKRPAVRIPLIGGFNASEADARGFARLFLDLGLPENGTLELLTYHEYGRQKYRDLGMEYTMTDSAKITPQMLRTFTGVLQDAGIQLIHT